MNLGYGSSEQAGNDTATHVWKKYLDQLRSPPTIYTSYKSLEKMQPFDAIYKLFGRAVLRPLRSKGV